MSKVTKNTFNDRLSSAVRSDGSLAGEIQALVTFAKEHYQQHGDMRYFDALMNAGWKASRKEAIRAYICAHANVKCSLNKETNEFKFAVDVKSKLKKRTIAWPVKDGVTITWHEFTKEPVNVVFDIDARIKALIATAKKAVEDKKAKVKGTRKHINDVIKSLEALEA